MNIPPTGQIISRITKTLIGAVEEASREIVESECARTGKHLDPIDDDLSFRYNPDIKTITGFCAHCHESYERQPTPEEQELKARYLETLDLALTPIR